MNQPIDSSGVNSLDRGLHMLNRLSPHLPQEWWREVYLGRQPARPSSTTILGLGTLWRQGMQGQEWAATARYTLYELHSRVPR